MMPQSPVTPSERPRALPTGVPGLDHVLGGGIVQGSSVLIDGPPGSGKSTLGLRLLHEGIERHGEPGLMLAFEEFPRQVHQAALDAGIDLRAHEEAGSLRILWTSPQRILEALQGGSDLLERVMVSMGARRVLVDSVTHFRRVPAIAQSESAMREIIGTMLQQMKLRGVTTILVKELDAGSPRSVAFEEYLVDTSVRLHHSVAGIGTQQEARFLEVRKARGLANAQGLHPFELGGGGPRVRVRWTAEALSHALPERPRPAPAPRRSSGVDGLDAALGGGFVAGTLALVEGDSGSGRSTLAQQCAVQSLREGRRAAVVLLRETREDWMGRAAALGADAEAAAGRDDLRIEVLAEGGSRMERAQEAVLAAVTTFGASCVVVDGLADLPETGDAGRAGMAAFLEQAARRTGALIVATCDHRQRSELQPEDLVRPPAGTVVVLQARHRDERMERRLLVLKHRHSGHALESLPFELRREGMFVQPRESPSSRERGAR